MVYGKVVANATASSCPFSLRQVLALIAHCRRVGNAVERGVRARTDPLPKRRIDTSIGIYDYAANAHPLACFISHTRADGLGALNLDMRAPPRGGVCTQRLGALAPKDAIVIGRRTSRHR